MSQAENRDFTVGINEGCLSGHYWNGTSQCSLCGARLRCTCGVYVRADNLERHFASSCRVVHAESSTGSRAANHA